MAGSRTPGPLGTRGYTPPPGGSLSRSDGGGRTPGPLGVGANAEAFGGTLSHAGAFQSGSADFAFEGETFRIVRVPDRYQFVPDHRYEIVPRSAAREILRRMMTAHSVLVGVALLAAESFRSESNQSALLLLRLLPAPAGSAPLAAAEAPRSSASTPSQRRAPEPDPEPIREKVNPEILAAPLDLDTSEDGFVAESEPSEAEETSETPESSESPESQEESEGSSGSDDTPNPTA